MATIKQLIQQLQAEPNQEQAIVFQYLLAEHTSYSPDDFEQLSERLDDTDFADSMSREFLSWLDEMDDERWEDEEEDED